MPFSFPFTFRFAVPGLANPFSAPSVPISHPTANAGSHHRHHPNPIKPERQVPQNSQDTGQHRRPSPGPSRSPAAPLSRKRGWEPAFSSPTQSSTTLTTTSGYLDTPAKYRAMAAASPSAMTSGDDFHEVENADDPDAELPPAKRRRGFAGSIVSTAVSAALIGTAVGLTVYRLWRDRGKEIEQLPPPPPYQQGGWTPVKQTQQQAIDAPPKNPPDTPRTRRTRQIAASNSRRIVAYRARQRTRAPLPSLTSRSHGLTSPPPPEFDFAGAADDAEETVEEQMDWIGGKLAQLIEEGKKALGREVVVMSEVKEDELDDGSGAWVEDTQGASCSKPLSRKNSLRRLKRPAALNFASSPPPSYSPPTVSIASSAPYYASGFEHGSPPRTPVSRPAYGRGVSVDADLGVGSGLGFRSSSWKDDGRSMESPELKEAMERARARFSRSCQGAT